MIFASYRSLTGMAMYSPEDAPASGPPGTGKTSISADLTFKRDNKKMKGQVQLLVIPDKDMDGVTTKFCFHFYADVWQKKSKGSKSVFSVRLRRVFV